MHQVAVVGDDLVQTQIRGRPEVRAFAGNIRPVHANFETMAVHKLERGGRRLGSLARRRRARRDPGLGERGGRLASLLPACGESELALRLQRGAPTV